MSADTGITRWQTFLLWTALLLYAQGRICQLYPDRISIQLIVFLQVVPPAVLALVHGSILYGVKGMSAFATFCLGIGAASESLSLRTGFPFGHYYFTNLMGPHGAQVLSGADSAYPGLFGNWLLLLGAQSINLGQ